MTELNELSLAELAALICAALKKEGRPEKFKVFEERYKKEIKKNEYKARGKK